MITNRDMLMYLYALEREFDFCAAQVDALRSYYEWDETQASEAGK